MLTTLGNRPLRKQRRVAVQNVQKRRKKEYFSRKITVTPLFEQEEVAMRRQKYSYSYSDGGEPSGF